MASMTAFDVAWTLVPAWVCGVCLWAAVTDRGRRRFAAEWERLGLPLKRPWHLRLVAAVLALAPGALLLEGRRGLVLVPYWSGPAEGAYTTVFVVWDAYWRQAAGYVGWAAPGLALLLGAILSLASMRGPDARRRGEVWRAGALLVFGLAWVCVTALVSSQGLRASRGLVQVYRAGAAQAVEGTVHVLREQPAGGHGEEDRVEIGGVRLGVNRFVSTAAYTRTIAHGGALREGTAARVWYHGDRVLRVDVRR